MKIQKEKFISASAWFLFLLPAMQIGQAFIGVDLSPVYPLIMVTLVVVSLPIIIGFRRAGVLKPVYLWLFFIIFLYLSLFVSTLMADPSILSASRAFFFNLSVVAYLGASSALLLNKRSVEYYIQLFLLLSASVSTLIIIGAVVSGGDFRRIFPGAENYLFPGMYAAVGVMISFARLLFRKQGYRRSLLFFILCVGGVSFSLSRGAIFSSMLAMMAISYLWSMQFIRRRRSRSNLNRALMVFIITIALLLLAFEFLPELTKERFSKIFLFESGDVKISLHNRTEVWRDALEHINESFLFGQGIGSWYPIYPHNVIFQAWMDGGLVSAIISVVIFFAPLFYLLSRYRVAEFEDVWLYCATLGAYLSLLIEFMKSHDYYTGFVLWIFAGMCFSVTKANPIRKK